MLAPEIEPGFSGSVVRNSDHVTTETISENLELDIWYVFALVKPSNPLMAVM
jgi:hypothetical protein